MFAVLAVSALAFVASPALCTYYDGEGNFYFSLADDFYIDGGVRIVYRPERPEIYCKPEFRTYLAFALLGDRTSLSVVSNLTHSKYEHWTLMKWERYGLYYYADLLDVVLPEFLNMVVYGADVLNGGELIYSDELRFKTMTKHLSYCVLDADQKYHTDFKCSEALNKDEITTVTRATPSYGDDSLGSNSSSVIIGVFVPSLILLLAIIFITCIRRQRVLRRAGGNTEPSAEVVEHSRESHDRSHSGPHGRSHGRSHGTTDLPPPYIIALQTSVPDESALVNKPLENAPEQPPSYDLAVRKLSTDELRELEIPGNAIQLTECSSNNLPAEVTRTTVTDTTSHADVGTYV